MSITPINPAAIPQVHGDMVALSQSAQSKRRYAEALIQRGVDVHAAWQGLAAVYHAPEAAMLYVAMAPVRDLAGRVGHSAREVAIALDHYASEMGPIKQKLRNLRAEAEALAAEIGRFTAAQDEHRRRDEAATTAGDLFGINNAESWFDDPILKQRHDELIRRINQAVADRQACEVDCANAIGKTHGGRRYHTGNADGQHQPGEYGWSAEQYNQAADDQGVPWGQTTSAGGGFDWSEAGHLALDGLGMVPLVGNAADLANAAWYAGEGDYTNAGLSAGAAVPGAGQGVTGAKWAAKGAAAGAAAWGSRKAAQQARKHTDDAAEAGAKGVKNDIGEYWADGATPKASDLDKYGHAQGWSRTQTETGPPTYRDENGIRRMLLKRGSQRTPGSEHPHVELRDTNGDRMDPHGNPVSKRDAGNHAPIEWDW